MTRLCRALLPRSPTKGVEQIIYYQAGVGSQSNLSDHVLGGGESTFLPGWNTLPLTLLTSAVPARSHRRRAFGAYPRGLRLPRRELRARRRDLPRRLLARRVHRTKRRRLDRVGGVADPTGAGGVLSHLQGLGEPARRWLCQPVARQAVSEPPHIPGSTVCRAAREGIYISTCAPSYKCNEVADARRSVDSHG